MTGSSVSYKSVVSFLINIRRTVSTPGDNKLNEEFPSVNIKEEFETFIHSTRPLVPPLMYAPSLSSFLFSTAATWNRLNSHVRS